MASVNFYKALRIIALRDVIEEPPEYHLRFINRWYSKNFHVPLPEVDSLDQEHILQTFYETKYEEMSAEEREDERLSLLETDEQKAERVKKEEKEAASEAEFHKMVDEMAKESAKALPKPKLIAPIPEPTPMKPVGVGAPLPPNIKLNFVSSAEFEAELEGSGMGDPTDGNLPLKVPEQ